jgi:hypothetical protein
VKRQALYACLTCTPAAPEADSAGICLACSLSCHDGHELVELYTKRYWLLAWLHRLIYLYSHITSGMFHANKLTIVSIYFLLEGIFGVIVEMKNLLTLTVNYRRWREMCFLHRMFFFSSIQCVFDAYILE